VDQAVRMLHEGRHGEYICWRIHQGAVRKGSWSGREVEASSRDAWFIACN